MAYEPPFLYQATLGHQQLAVGPSSKHTTCKCCQDTGSYSKGDRFELCQFCTDLPVLLHGRYQIVKKAGEGAFSSVYLATDLFLGQAVVALKIFHAPYQPLADEEVAVLKLVRAADPNGAFGCLKFLQTFRHNRTHQVIVLESLVTTDLFERSSSPTTADSPVSLQHLKQLLFNLALPLFILHEKLDRLHADIKPENILFCRAERTFRLVDYGSSVPLERMSDYFADFELASYLYRSPEVLVGIPFGLGLDIWSLGCVIYEAAAKRPLCSSLDRTECLVGLTDLVGPLPDEAAGGKFFAETVPLISAFDEQDPKFWNNWRASNLMQQTGIRDWRFLDLLTKMLDPNPTTRITIREILEHPCLASFVPFKPPSVQAHLPDENTKPPIADGRSAKLSRKVPVIPTGRKRSRRVT